MNILTRKLITLLAAVGLLSGAFLMTGTAAAQDGLQVDVTTEVVCDTASFDIAVSGGSGAHDLTVEFGDGNAAEYLETSTYPLEVDHTYAETGEYSWSVMAVDSADEAIAGQANGTLSISGPSVTLTSEPSPAALSLPNGSVEVLLSAEVEGGTEPYAFEWDFDSDGIPDTGTESTAQASFSEAGEYEAMVTVTDDCGFSDSAAVSIVVFDPEEACHPRAQEIAMAVSSLYPEQAEQLYSCESILEIHRGELTDGMTIGYGRMWKAYQLTSQIEELTWEEILDWHLNQGGWGLLEQLDGSADSLDEVTTDELVALVVSGEASVNDIRSATRAALREGADFYETLGIEPSVASPAESNGNGEDTRAGESEDQAQGSDGALESIVEDLIDNERLQDQVVKLLDRRGVTAEQLAEIQAECGQDLLCYLFQMIDLVKASLVPSQRVS